MVVLRLAGPIDFCVAFFISSNGTNKQEMCEGGGALMRVNGGKQETKG